MKLNKHFSKSEQHGLFFAIAGVMMFKLAFETLSPAVGAWFSSRFKKDSAFNLAMTNICYGVCQSIGSSMTPIVGGKHLPSRIIAVSLFIFSLFVVGLLLEEAFSGGTVDEAGSVNPWNILIFYLPIGFCVGAIELARRIIAPSIVGLNVDNLRRLDSLIHIWYEVAGTSGAFLSTALIASWGEVYGLAFIPFAFIIAGALYWQIRPREASKEVIDGESFKTSKKAAAIELENFKTEGGEVDQEHIVIHQVKLAKEKENSSSLESLTKESQEPSFSSASVGSTNGATVPEAEESVPIYTKVYYALKSYFVAVKKGCAIIFSSRDTAWLILGYVIPLVLHRLIENTLVPIFSNKVLKSKSLTGVMIGGSNFGELLGAACVFIFMKYVPSPLFWVRLDALLLNLLWIFAFVGSPDTANETAGFMVPVMMFISGSWAAGDVSLLAYLQTSLSKIKTTRKEEQKEDAARDQCEEDENLSAAMSFLYALYVLFATGFGYGLGRVFAHFEKKKKIHEGFFWVSGVSASVLSVIIFASTFIPPQKPYKNFNPEAQEIEVAPDGEERKSSV